MCDSMVLRYMPNSGHGGPPGTQFMTIFVFYVNPKIPIIEYFVCIYIFINIYIYIYMYIHIHIYPGEAIYGDICIWGWRGCEGGGGGGGGGGAHPRPSPRLSPFDQSIGIS